MLNVSPRHQEVFRSYVTGRKKTHSSSSNYTRGEVWPAKCCVICIPYSLMSPASQFSSWPCVRQSSGYHTHTHSITCVLTHHHTATSERTRAQCTCLPAKCGRTTAGRPKRPPLPHPSHSTSWVINRRCLPSEVQVQRPTLSIWNPAWTNSVSPLTASVKAKTIVYEKTFIQHLSLARRGKNGTPVAAWRSVECRGCVVARCQRLRQG